MPSLGTHLRESGDHGSLGFHPACPVCRDTRLSGSLGEHAFVSRRTQALLNVGLIVVSSAAPAAPALAADGDQELVGRKASARSFVR